MKKIILALSLVITMTASSAFAEGKSIPAKALASFKADFSEAQEINWTTGDDYYVAKFVLHGQTIFAYYSPDGDYLSTLRNISTLQLPINLLRELKNDYSSYWVSNLIEIGNSDGTTYYVTLENADKKLTLKSKNSGYWDSYSKKQKA